MALYRKSEDGTWHFSIYVPGKRSRLKGSCGTKNREEAELIERSMRLAVTKQSPREKLIRLINAIFPEENERKDSIPLASLVPEVARCRALHGRTITESTRRMFDARLRDFVEWCGTHYARVTDAYDVDRVCAQTYAAFRANRKYRGKRLATRTRRKEIGDLATAWRELQRQHDGLENPWPLAMPVKEDGARGNAFTPEEARRIFEAGDADGHGWGIAARLAACTGLRMGDVLTIRHEDIVDGVLHVRPNKTKRHGITVHLPLPPDLLDLIGTGKGHVMPELAEAYKPGLMKTLVFTPILVAAGVDPKRYTFHSFRHFFRTQLAKAGVSDDVAMRLGGWTQRETAALYDHDDHRAQLGDAINRAWMA